MRNFISRTLTAILFSSLLVNFIPKLKAQSLNNGIGVFAAAEMRYECTGTDKYNVVLDVYAECGYFDGSLNNKDNYPITIKSTSLDVEFDGVLLKPNVGDERNGEEINIFCEDEPSQCDTRDEASPRGLKKYSYTGAIDLTLWGKADDWIVFWARNNRSEEISSIGEKQPYHAEVRIDNKAGCSSSPTFGEGENEVSSIVTLCKGDEGKSINLNAIDPDGNALKYSIVSPLKGLGDNLSYGSGVSAASPLGSGSSVSITNGSLFLKSEISQEEFNGTFDLLVEELNSSGDVVGSARKGFQVTSLTCSNNSPEIGEFDDSLGYDITFCAGEQIDLRIHATDADTNKMRFISNPVIIKSNPFARTPIFTKNTFDSNPNFKYSSDPEGRFIWTPSAADTGTFTITVEIQDNACPVQGVSTQEFIIRVNPIPSFTLGGHRPYECEPFLFEPEITHGGNSVSYEWKPWSFDIRRDTVLDSNTVLSTDPSIFIDSPSKLYFIAKDDAGCEKSEYVDIFKSLEAVGTYEKFCVDQITTFRDSSTYRESSFVSRLWTVETSPTTYTDAVFDYAFQDEGFYDVKLLIENNFGCKDSIVGQVPIVPHPTPVPAFHDFCSGIDNWDLDGDTLHGVDLKDLTEYAVGDSRDTVWWQISDANGNVVADFPWEEELYPDYPFPDSGRYQVRLITKSRATCVDTSFADIDIIQRPEIDMITDLYLPLDCADPDTVFQAVIDDYFVGTEPIEWYTIDLSNNVTVNQGLLPPGDTLKFPVDTTGWYQFRIVDSNGCDHYETFTVQFPVFADFAYETACSEGPVQFRDFSRSDTTQRTIVDWEWDFRDGNTASGKDPIHQFAAQGDYDVILNVTDSEGCELRDTMTVYYTFPTEVFEITPDLQLTKQCVDDTITAINYSLDIGLPYHIDTIRWEFQELVGAPQSFEYKNYPNPIDVLTYNMIDNGLQQEYIFTDTTSSITITSYMRYNRNSSNRLDTTQGCVVERQLSESFEILPKFDGDILDNRVCIGDSGIFQFNRSANPEILVETAYWEFYSSKTASVIATSTELEPQVFVNEQLVNRGASQLRVEANFVDVNGCDFRDVAIIEVDEVTAKPRWDFGQEICKGQPQIFTIESDQGDVDFWQIAQNYNEVKDEGAFIAPTLENPVIGMTSISFDSSGKYPISVFLIKNVSLENNKICRSRLDDSITVWDTPTYDIVWDTVCATYPITFNNNSSTNGDFGNALKYFWDFGDGNTAETLPGESVTHQYQYGGYYTVRLSATTDKGCNNSVGVFDSVYVRPTPEIDFITDQELEADALITFTDDSELYGANPVKMTWDFGDRGYFEYDTTGGVDVQTYAEVQWDSVGIYYIKHSVTTEDGCTGFNDSIRIDLNTYLELPNAFSPNGDGENEGLSLIHKSIRELYTYKIFNRWGQVVFDSEGDIEARWDGTYNGAEQEIGVYVAHVHALGAYDTEFNFKVNVKLIR